MVTAYCPVKTGRGNSIYTHQLRVLKKDPTKCFWSNLGHQIMQWMADREQLLLSGNWNEDIMGTNLKEWMALFKLQEMVTSLHDRPPPATFIRGQDLINGIFGNSLSIRIS